MGSTGAIPKTMHAWRKHRGNSKPIWEEIPVPKTPPNGVLCKMLAAGVCRSDQSLLAGQAETSWFQDEWTLGHEGCGRIIDIGDQVKNPSFKVGDVIALFAVPGCGKSNCTECSRDLAQLCEAGHHSGIGQDGFFAPYATVDARGVVVVPEGVTPAQAAIATDAVTTAYHAITRRAEVKSTETVFLFGLGGLGFNALQVARHIGARVIISDVKQVLLDEAAALGVPQEDIVPVGVSPREFVAEKGLHIDTVLDFVGMRQTFEDAQHIVRRGGKLLCAGSISTENTVFMKIGTRKRLSFIFTYGGQPRDVEEVLRLIADGVIQPRVTPARLEEFPEKLAALVDGKVEGRTALIME
ncbi:alcohol dehydrogenase groES-like domain-containing protein [Sarocladium implicatum]|nr:alcohol dehydrogenase groES-like domain-containing protein [Sarocladium implicatum]